MTEIRGPYYSPMGKRYLEDILETIEMPMVGHLGTKSLWDRVVTYKG